MNNFFRKDHKKILLVLFMFLVCFCLYANGNGSRELDLPLVYAITFFMGIAFFFQGWVISGIVITVVSFLLYAAKTNPSIFSDAARELLH